MLPVKLTKLAPVAAIWIAAIALVALLLQNFPLWAAPLPESAVADRVLVVKAKRELFLIEGGEVLKTYRISLGGHPVGHKIREGDSRTPEGQYVLDWHNPDSHYYKSIHISYPNPQDMARAQKLGVPPGEDLFIHGQPNDYEGPGKQSGDWTDGCIAVSNVEMDEIWRAVPDGTPIEIKR
jgi:murein L,D-transpeptidase YafK